MCACFSSDSEEITLSLEKAILWIEDTYFSQKQQFEVKILMSYDEFVYYKQGTFYFTRQLLDCIIVMFL